MDHSSDGFSLIEVILVLSIIAVLAALALPQFGRLAQTSHRQLMQAELLQISQGLEQAYSRSQSYSAIELGSFPADSPRYSLSLQIADDGQTFTLRADPMGEQVGDGYLTIDSSGAARHYKGQDGSYVSW